MNIEIIFCFLFYLASIGDSSGSDDDNEWLIAQEPYESPTSITGPNFGFADKCQGLTTEIRVRF